MPHRACFADATAAGPVLDPLCPPRPPPGLAAYCDRHSDQYWSPDRARSRDIGSIKNILLTSSADLILERPDESAFELKRLQMLSADSVNQ